MGTRVIRYDNIIPKDERDNISSRYRQITKAVNREFWGTASETSNSIYVGSYGRNTAISTSDIDILVCLPFSKFDSYNRLTGNGQSKLLQAVRQALKVSYPNSDIRADGQIVKINFYDGISFEILPAFKNLDGSYTYADSNMGGRWRSTNPKEEQSAIREKNNLSNGLLVATCRHIRYVRDNFYKSYKLPGIVIDSFAYYAISDWKFVNFGEKAAEPGTYEKQLLNYFEENRYYWERVGLYAPGSNEYIDVANSMESLEKVLRYMNG